MKLQIVAVRKNSMTFESLGEKVVKLKAVAKENCKDVNANKCCDLFALTSLQLFLSRHLTFHPGF